MSSVVGSVVAYAARWNSSQEKTMPKHSLSNTSVAAILICVCTLAVARADVARDTDAIATRHVVSTGAGRDIPAGAFGFLLIERPREVTLLALRGIGGRGRVVIRTDEPGVCLTLPVRFVAGDFGGESISGHLAEPIHFIIRSREVAMALAKGRDVVSDGYTVSAGMDPGADIVLRSGLDESFGFVINPGRNILGDIFGVRAKRVPCRLV